MAADINKNRRKLEALVDETINRLDKMRKDSHDQLNETISTTISDLSKLKAEFLAEGGDLDEFLKRHRNDTFDKVKELLPDIDERIEKITGESQRWGNRYDNAVGTFSRAKKEFSNSAKSSFAQTFVTDFSGKMAHGLTTKLGYSETTAAAMQTIAGGAASVAYQVLKLVKFRPDAILLTTATQLICPLTERGLKAAGYNPAKAIAMAVLIKTAAQIYANPIEGVANIGGTLCGNAGGTLVSEWATQAVFGVKDSAAEPSQGQTLLAQCYGT